jgi:hypothetical protein
MAGIGAGGCVPEKDLQEIGKPVTGDIEITSTIHLENDLSGRLNYR